MVTIFCKLERIGGYAGKRVQVLRLKSLSNFVGNIYKVTFENKSDILKVKNEAIDLDRFMSILKNQTLDSDGSGFLGNCYGHDTLVLLEYNKGEVCKFGLIAIKDLPYIKPDENKVPFLDLTKDYPFKLNDLYAKII